MSIDLDPSRLDRMIRFSLDHPLLSLALAGVVLFLGPFWVAGLPVDIFPDLQAPTVTVITEVPGLAPEEVELLVTLPLESAVNGAPGLRRLRSVSADGIAVLWVEFDWGEDVYRARQVVAERLQRVTLPAQVERPELGPISSIMGEITFIARTLGCDRVIAATTPWHPTRAAGPRGPGWDRTPRRKNRGSNIPRRSNWFRREPPPSAPTTVPRAAGR